MYEGSNIVVLVTKKYDCIKSQMLDFISSICAIIGFHWLSFSVLLYYTVALLHNKRGISGGF